MDFSVEKDLLCNCRIIREAKAEQVVDSDMTLPDYCPDIKSILRCSVEPGINSVNVIGNRITAQGNAVIRLVYVSTDDKISCFEQNYPMDKYVEMSSLTAECQAVATAKVSYVNCRAVSPRRVDIHGCISVMFSVFRCEKQEFVSGVQGEYIQQRFQPLSVCNAVGCISKLFDMSEVVPIGNTESPVKSIAYADGFSVLSEIKAVSNKLLLKGEFVLNVSLCCEDGTVRKTEHSMPISRIIELDGVDESCICDVSTKVCSLDVQLRADENGNMTNLDTAVCMQTFVRAYREHKCACVQDAYSLKSELELSKSAVEVNRYVQTLDENFLVAFQTELDSCDKGEIIDCRCDTVTNVSSSSPDGIEVSGTVTVCITYLDDDGKPAMAQRQNEYHFVKCFEGITGKLVCDSDVSAVAVSAVGRGSGVSVKVQLNIRGIVFESQSVRAVSDVNEISAAKDARSSSITVYFSESGENLWDIAKRYNTSEEAIRRRNNVKGDVIEKETMLIIPQV